MKIKKAVFHNFSAIKNAMGANTVTIDFTKSKNKICLIIGHNGSGKTTILSMLHPFADLGNLDVRNGNDFVLKGEEGQKEIIIDDNDVEYTIKHIYSPHKDKSHSVKSYIAKNGVELNKNGNVSSFKEYVKEELQIEPEYLKLIRLGANVTNLINLSATERKNFMSKILEDVGVYLEYYKSINSKLRELSNIISHDEDRMNRLNILDESMFKQDIERLKLERDNVDLLYINTSNKIAVHMDAIKDINDPDALMLDRKDIKKKLHKLELIKERSGKVKDLTFYDTEIKKLDKDNAVYEEKIKTSSEFVQRSLNQLDNIMDRRRNCEIRASKEADTSKELNKMNDNLSKIRLRLRQYEKNIGDYNPKYTKDDVINFVRVLHRIDEILDTTYTASKSAIEKVIDLMNENRNVQSYIDRHKIAVDEKYSNKDTLFLVQVMNILNSNPDTVFVCKEECQARYLFERLKLLMDNAEAEDDVSDGSFYTDMDIAYNNIQAICNLLNPYKELIELLPDKIKDAFLSKNLFDKLKKHKPIYDKEEVNNLLSMIGEYDNYLQALEDYTKEEDNLRKFSDLASNDGALEELDEINAEIDGMREDIRRTKEEIVAYKEIISDNTRTLDTYKDIREMVSEYDTTRELFNSIDRQCEEYMKHKGDILSLSDEVSKYSIQKELLSKEIQDKESDLSVYKDLKRQLKKYHKIYDDMVLIKEALSSKEGIPLYFITNYLGNVEGTTNELLDIVYKGETYIDNFVITATEFSIPFYHNGVRLNDVKYASQGELSFLSLALSFALSSQAIGHYNIMLWDEIDGVLDTRNREKFIDVLENQIERVDSEQNFLITHNNMFSSYPIDILDLSFDNDVEAYPLANYIPIERE